MNRLVTVCLIFIILPVVHEARGEDAGFDAQAFVERVDEARVPSGDFSVDVVIETESKGKRSTAQYEVMLNGNRDSVVRTTYPPAERGQVMLMKGHDFWVYLPTVDQPVRLSLSQILAGQVSNGDIARMNFKDDYKATLLRTEDLNGKKAAVIELIASWDWVTYEKIVLWADIHSARPIKAEFLTSSGILLKTCSYEKYENLAGAQRPTRLVFSNPLNGGERSVLSYNGMRTMKLPKKFFNKEYMKRLN